MARDVFIISKAGKTKEIGITTDLFKSSTDQIFFSGFGRICICSKNFIVFYLQLLCQLLLQKTYSKIKSVFFPKPLSYYRSADHSKKSTPSNKRSLLSVLLRNRFNYP
jgi:hypothetical protein